MFGIWGSNSCLSDLLSLLASGCSFFAGPAGKEFAAFFGYGRGDQWAAEFGKKARNVRAWAVRVNRPTLALLFHVLASQGITSSGLDSAHRGNQAVHLLALLGEPGVEIEMARRRYASQRFTALGVGNQAASLLRLGRHAGTEELEA